MAEIYAYSPFNANTDFAELIPTNIAGFSNIRTNGSFITSAQYNAPSGDVYIYIGSLAFDLSSGFLIGVDKYDGSLTVEYSIRGTMDMSQFSSYEAALSYGTPTFFSGDDSMFGSDGTDYFFGFAGDDTIYGGGASANANDNGDILVGGEGSDTIYGNGGNDIIYGGSGVVSPVDSADTLYGGFGDDKMYGNGGNDILYAGPGEDDLYGGAGNDTLVGGADSDLFIVGADYDLIADFEAGVDIVAIMSGQNGITNHADVLANMAWDSNGVFLDLGAGNGVTLCSCRKREVASTNAITE